MAKGRNKRPISPCASMCGPAVPSRPVHSPHGLSSSPASAGISSTLVRSRSLPCRLKPKSRNRSGPSLTTLAHAYPFADFNLHNRHSRKNQLLSKNLGSTLTATGAPPPARMARSARQSSRARTSRLSSIGWRVITMRTPALVAEAARQRCGSGTTGMLSVDYRCAFWSAKA